MSRRLAASLAILLFASSLLSNGCASKSQSSAASGSSMTAMAGAMAGAASLFNSLGGASGVTALASAFGVNLGKNSALASLLGNSGIEAAKNGLFNTIAKAGGQSLAPGSVDLLGALTGKGLDAAGVKGVGEALTGAAASQKLKPDQLAALASLWEPIGKSLLGGK